MPKSIRWGIASIVLSLCLSSCTGNRRPEVVVYASLDELYSRPILEEFERVTGIRARVRYDSEASKTTGLVNRLIAERNRPGADVYWSNELIQTVRLKQEGLLAPYASHMAQEFPAHFKDPEGYWTGFAARARVIIYNTDLVDDPPRSLQDFTDAEWKGLAAIANPLFGTTAAHAAALFAAWGDEKAEAYFHALKANDIAILPENATVRDLVARGEYAVGLTDTDDANGAVLDGFPVRWHLAENDSALGATLVLPNTVALIEGGPNGEHAKALIDYLLSPEVEEALAASRAIQIPLNPEAATPENVPVISSITRMDIDFAIAAEKWPRVASFIETEFLP
ncbi:MAG: extracellular solute-binding protein [Candidatus Hydrogenedentes bacterium]|nr:extracellular solute-binding protein [Candidatus Hydrogenedentota bacterium]